jgi:2'-5' RNA ligase
VLHRLARLYEIAIQGATQGATKCYTRCYIFKNGRKLRPDQRSNNAMSDASQPQYKRLFVALAAPDAVKSAIEKAQNELQRELPDGSVRWTRSEHFHLTIRFLGNVAVDRIEALSDKLQFTCRQFAQLKIRAERIGFFPERGFPRVIWVSVRDEHQQLIPLHRAIQTSTIEFTSEPAENKFSGHITLGRAKKIRRREAETLSSFAARMRQRSFGEWTADSLELLRSELLPDGAHHTVIATIPLGGSR